MESDESFHCKNAFVKNIIVKGEEVILLKKVMIFFIEESAEVVSFSKVTKVVIVIGDYILSTCKKRYSHVISERDKACQYRVIKSCHCSKRQQ